MMQMKQPVARVHVRPLMFVTNSASAVAQLLLKPKKIYVLNHYYVIHSKKKHNTKYCLHLYYTQVTMLSQKYDTIRYEMLF